MQPLPIPPPRTKKQLIKKKLDEWYDWLFDHIPKNVKEKVSDSYNKLKNNIMKMFDKPFPILKAWQTALKGRARTFVINGEPTYDPYSFLDYVRNVVIDFLRRQENEKIELVLECNMFLQDPSTSEITKEETHAFCSAYFVLLRGSNVEEIYEKMCEKILSSFVSMQKVASGWQFKSIKWLLIHSAKYKPLKGSSYIPTPKKLKDKKAIINPKNDFMEENDKDQQCFKWAVTIALSKTLSKNPERITKEIIKESENFNWKDIRFPTPIEDIKKFERNNSLKINLFGYDNVDEVFSMAHIKEDPDIRLLLLNNKHYVVINNMSRLIKSQVTKRKTKIYICDYCLQYFGRENLLNKHKDFCTLHTECKTVFPKENSFIEFKNYERIIKVPFVIYADFECFVKPIHKKLGQGMTQYQKHTPSGFCYLVKCFDDSIYKPKLVHYTIKNKNGDVSKVFVEKLEDEIKKLYHKFKFSRKADLKKEDIKNFKKAKFCYVCGEDFKNSDTKVLDHCHFTGNYRGAAHNKCNLRMKKPKFIPVVFHNLEGYDSHLFIKALAETPGKISCIPKNEEKYISFTKDIVVDTFNKNKKTYEVKRQLRFIDSFKFMSSSLESLVKNLEKQDLKLLERFFPKHQELLSRKGIYPYDYMDFFEKLSESSLPKKEEFYSKLNDESISNEDYDHVKNIWDTFNMKTLEDYHDLYLKTDVVLLCDVFEKFREICMKNYNLDPAWYYTSPGLAWDAALKQTKISLELLHQQDMHLMIEKGKRGGVSMITKRYAIANNKYLSNYDSKKPSIYIPYLDANNLYGWAMMQKLPSHDFKYMDEEELKNWSNLENENRGCILEVDLDYLKELHNPHNDSPLAPAKLVSNLEGINVEK